MRQRFFPRAHGGRNLSGNTLQRFPTATLRSPRRYEPSVWANRTWTAFLGIIYADPSPNVPPNAMLGITPGWSANRMLSRNGLVRRMNEAPMFAHSSLA